VYSLKKQRVRTPPCSLKRRVHSRDFDFGQHISHRHRVVEVRPEPRASIPKIALPSSQSVVGDLQVDRRQEHGKDFGPQVIVRKYCFQKP
jgi:hypothetical protein